MQFVDIEYDVIVEAMCFPQKGFETWMLDQIEKTLKYDGFIHREPGPQYVWLQTEDRSLENYRIDVGQWLIFDSEGGIQDVLDTPQFLQWFKKVQTPDPDHAREDRDEQKRIADL